MSYYGILNGVQKVKLLPGGCKELELATMTEPDLLVLAAAFRLNLEDVVVSAAALAIA